MAAAEARAAWQRTANRCFVQEDAKRAPKLACCPSSSTSSKPQFDGGHGDAASGRDHPTAGFMPYNWNPSNSNIPPDTKWWLQLQPNFGYHKDLTYEQLNTLEAELEVLRAEVVNKTSKFSGGPQSNEEEDSMHVDSNKNTGSSLDPQWRVSAACLKHDPEVRMQELKAVNSNNTEEELNHKDTGEYWYQNEELMGLDLVNHLMSKQPDKLCFDFESPWMGGQKTEPWWRTADKDELASLVAQKSLEHIENCDLPRPQTKHVRRGPFPSLGYFNHDGIFSSSLDQKEYTGLSNPTDYARGSPTSGGMGGKQWASDEVGDSVFGSDKPFSNNSYSTIDKDMTETRHITESNPSKAQLLEALRHSQTRAREAEKAAQQAYTEKEHIIKLFFRQASHLFAYKQWFRLLQLETLCLQLKNKDQPISTLFPVVLPWMPCKGRQMRKSRRKGSKGKRAPSKYDISKYAVAFAVGLSLAGAGLLLGWTMGWLLPTF
ncbi:hypothetical protein HHK36_027478 [Tetracentron sinense]|uniref:Uncharacterized protein n=1 Tax=Tetracentron sinense TaxID=13715 RepID=A0A834YEX7_TETSI|nr:hypothetical protein HHK36_027478 [Tetracentron sinense]